MIKEAIRSFIAEKILFRSDGFPYADTVSFLDNGIIDSMNVVELVMFIEEKFGITVDDSDVIPKNFDSVERLAEYTRLKIQEKS